MANISLDGRAWSGLNNLLNRPWFHRVWTFQEIVVSTHAIIFCGEFSIPWTIFLAYRGNLLQQIPALSLAFDLKALNAIDITSIQYRMNGSIGLLPLLMGRWSSQATDPKDKVFALLGIASEGQENLMEINYEMPVERVYSAAAKAIICRSANLNVLSTVQAQDTSMPSWVTDWRASRKREAIASFLSDNNDPRVVGSFSAAGKRGLHQGDGVWDELVLSGKHVSRIVTVGPPAMGGSGPGVPPATAQWFDSIRDLSEKSYPSTKTGETYLDAFSVTLIADRDHYTSETERRASRQIRYTLATLLRDRKSGGDMNGVFSMDWSKIPTKGLTIYSNTVWDVCQERRFLMTEDGYMGLAPSEAEVDDEICLLFGGEVPYVVRRVDQHHRFIGDCYVHGIMDGEAMEDESKPTVCYTLR
jgi:hypothetical protein